MGSNEYFTTDADENLDKALDIYADVINNPAFPADELETERKRALSDLSSAKIIRTRFQASSITPCFTAKTIRMGNLWAATKIRLQVSNAKMS